MYLPPPLSEQILEILLVFSHFLPLQLTVSLSLTSITLYGFAFHTAKEFLTILNIPGHKFFMHTSGFPYSMSLLSNYPLYLDSNCFSFQYCKFLCWFPMETKLPHTIKKTPRIYFSALINSKCSGQINENSKKTRGLKESSYKVNEDTWLGRTLWQNKRLPCKLNLCCKTKNPCRKKPGKTFNWNSYPLMHQKVNQDQDINKHGGEWEGKTNQNQTHTNKQKNHIKLR